MFTLRLSLSAAVAQQNVSDLPLAMKLRPCIAGPAISLHDAKGFAANFSNARALPERTSAIDLGVSGPIRNWRTSFLFDYDIFPRRIMRFEAEWKTAGRAMQVGDVILQRAV